MPSILVLRLSAMGDVAMTAPVIGQLRERYPELRIVLLTLPFFRPFFRGIERIDFIDLDLKKRHRGWLGMVRLSNDIRRAYKIDRVADLHDVIRTKQLRLLLAGRKIAVIDKGREEKKALTDLENKVFRPLKSTIARYAEVFAVLGYPVEVPERPERKKFPVPPAVDALVGPKEGPWIGIAPFAQHRGKVYPVELMERAIEALGRRGATRIFLFGGGDPEREVAERLERRHPHTFSVIGKIPLAEELDLISNLDAMVSMDSSAMHMASLVGTPVVSIWGATHPYTGFLGWGQSAGNAVQAAFPCRPCSIYGNNPCAYGDYRCMTQIPPEAIVEKTLALLDRPQAAL